MYKYGFDSKFLFAIKSFLYHSLLGIYLNHKWSKSFHGVVAIQQDYIWKQCSTSATAKDTAKLQGYTGGGSDMLTTSS